MAQTDEPLTTDASPSSQMPQLGTWKRIQSRLYRGWADVRRHFGNTSANQEEHWLAIEYYTRAIVIDPTYTQAYYSRGVLYWREIENYYRAIQDLTKVLELEPSWSLAYLNRGLAYKLRNEPEKAIIDFELYLQGGADVFWLDVARRQLAELGAGEQAPGQERCELPSASLED